MGARREWILTNQSAGNSRCGTVMDAFRRERIFTPNKREQLYLLLSKAHQESGIMTTGASSKSGVFTIQLTCSTGLSLRADSSRTGTPSRSAYESNRPHDVNKPGGCFTNVSWALQDILSKFVYCRNRTSDENFKPKLCTCAQSQCFGHTYRVSAWNSHHKCDFWHCVVLQDYFGELAKR